MISNDELQYENIKQNIETVISRHHRGSYAMCTVMNSLEFPFIIFQIWISIKKNKMYWTGLNFPDFFFLPFSKEQNNT